MNVVSFLANAFEFKKTETTRVPARTFHGLTFRVSGRISITPENGKRLISGKGSITYVPKGCSYDTEIIEDGSMYVIHFETADDHQDASPFVISPTYPIAFANLFGSLHERYRDVGAVDYAGLSMVYEILSELSTELERGVGKAVPKRMRLAKEYIDENYGMHDVTIPDLAAMSGISEVYFRREFKSCFGVSPLEYIKTVRMENAKALLSTAMYSVSEVATRCGFDSISYFSYEFGRVTGETPSEFSRRFEDKK